MTRIPLNRAFEESQDVRQRLEMSTAEIGLAVRTTNSGPSCKLSQTNRDLQSGIAMLIASGRHINNSPVNDLCLATHSVELINQ